jgi:uncharacterized Zn-finger protein
VKKQKINKVKKKNHLSYKHFYSYIPFWNPDQNFYKNKKLKQRNLVFQTHKKLGLSSRE